MHTFRTILLAAGALTAQVSLASDTPPPGPFTAPAVIFSGNTGHLAQTPSPDNRALSLLFQGLRVEQQGGGNRSDANHLALRIPLTVGNPTKLKAELRGAIAAGRGVECRISLEGPDGRAVLRGRKMPQAYLKTYIPVSASDNELLLLIGLRCTGKAGAHPYFLAEIDSLDLSALPQPRR